MAMLLPIILLGLFHLFLGTEAIQIPCGSSLIDPTQFQACCMPEGGGSPFTPFNVFTEICCSGEVSSSFEGGQDLACCGGMVQEKPLEMVCCGESFVNLGEGGLCCNGNVITDPPPNSACCGDEAIGNGQQCCNGNAIESNQSCCDGQSFDTSENTCCRNTLVSISDDNSFPGCCLQDNQTFTSFDINDQLCCNGMPVDILGDIDAGNAECCETAVIDKTKEICCNGMPVDILGDIDAGNAECCETAVIDKTKQICCNNMPIDIPSDINAANAECCGDEAIDKTKTLCCNEMAATFPDGTEEANAGCCGAEAIDSSKSVCCNETSTSLGTVDSMNAECCGTEVINNATELCCNNAKVVLPDGVDATNVDCCDPVALGQGICCDEIPFPFALQCCGAQGFNPAEEECCGGTVINPEEKQCCNDNVLEEGEVCCGGRVLDETINSCCGRANTIFDVTEFKCCGDLLVAIPPGLDPDSLSCCKNTVNGVDRFFPRLFNAETEACCAGQARPLDNIDPANADCCGPFVFDKTSHRCCRNRVFPRDSQNPRCRGLPDPE
ncbi:hypothetical protein TCAL_17063 [Tigriopus californicus]|uniref:Galaxin-like repeats domain-containing protein n=1 Tax=Tigriopus californicus TaxID=6832 RepID=A0A553PNL6_TIGCA|nr:hypothetical protein TCAL_17063 [Tigriopus californicus]